MDDQSIGSIIATVLLVLCSGNLRQRDPKTNEQTCCSLENKGFNRLLHFQIDISLLYFRDEEIENDSYRYPNSPKSQCSTGKAEPYYPDDEKSDEGQNQMLEIGLRLFLVHEVVDYCKV